ncbi:MAG TPA: polysaccharide biosynthesis tyrosine autokinase [Polyangiaceae bacterium]|nr:polysaccharide biosynthesis tyrosine autokinase [Polyangiaceae bacterium]
MAENTRNPSLNTVPESSSGLSPSAILRALRKNWLLGVGVALTVLLAVTFFTLGQTKIYRASAMIEIDPSPPRPLGDQVQGVVDMGAGTYLNNREYYETQYAIIKSMRLAVAVVRDLALNRDIAFIDNLPRGTKPVPREVSEETAAQVLRARVEVEPQKQSRLAKISYEDADPERAQRITAALIRRFQEQNLDSVLSSTTAAVEWLDDQLQKLSAELETSELALHKYKMNRNILSVSIDDQSNMLREEMRQLNTALTDARTRQQELMARYKALSEVTSTNPEDVPATELMNNQLISKLRVDYIDFTRRLGELKGSGKGEQHPSVVEVREKAEITKQALLAEVENVKRAVERDLSIVKRQAEGLRSLYENANKRALELNLLEIEYNTLRRTRDNTQKLYSVVQERAKESDLTRMLRVNNISVVDPPLLPRSPAKPSVPVSLIIGLFAGSVLGLGAALGRELLDRSIKVQEDLEHELGLTFLGMLPQAEGLGFDAGPGKKKSRRRAPKSETDISGKPELVVHEHPTSGLAEAARALRTNIMLMAPDRPYRALLVTSAAPEEGKTMFACSIATAMAQAGQKVVLVDCDMRRPRLHRIFGRAGGLGITTAMLDLGRLSDCLIPSPVPNMFVLPCGPLPPNPAELLHSEAFLRVLEELKSRFDRVVIDSPPIAPVTDATILSTRVDGTLLVVRAFKTTKDLARQCARSIRDVGGHIVGAVLNAVDVERRHYAQYYQYYYYRHEGYGTLEEQASSESRGTNPPASPPANVG